MLSIGCLIAFLVVFLVVVVFLDLVPFGLLEACINVVAALSIIAVVASLTI